MATINELLKQFEAAGAKFTKGLDQIPKDDPRYKDVWEYKCKIQTLFAEWYELLQKWADDETILPGDGNFSNWN